MCKQYFYISMIIIMFSSSEITQFNCLHIQIIEFKCKHFSGGKPYKLRK